MLLNEEKDENKVVDKKLEKIETKKSDKIESEKFVKKYVALKTIKVTCNTVFNLEKGKEIPEGIDKAFIQSLINSNIIK